MVRLNVCYNRGLPDPTLRCGIFSLIPCIEAIACVRVADGINLCGDIRLPCLSEFFGKKTEIEAELNSETGEVITHNIYTELEELANALV